jgi:hypothetical protein
MIVRAVSRAILSLAITASNEGTSVCWTVSNHITRSLAYDAQRVGISQKTINNMVRIFSWKIDFDRDLERGDRFIVRTRVTRHVIKGHFIAFFLINKTVI